MWFDLSLLEFSILPEQFWVAILSISSGNFDGAFIHIERFNGHWRFDFLWLRHFFSSCKS